MINNANNMELNKQKRGFDPYEVNGGNCIAIAGKDFVVMACDSRISRGYDILTRNDSKIKKFSKNCFILSFGMLADRINLWKKLEKEFELYEYKTNRSMNLESYTNLLGNILYEKKNFPFYTFNLAAGFDNNGESFVYNYDAIGSYEKKKFSFSGSAKELGNSIIDSQFEQYNNIQKIYLQSKDEIEKFILTVFNSLAERDLYCGDGVELITIYKDGTVEEKKHPLRFD